MWQPIKTAPKDGKWFLGWNGIAVLPWRSRNNSGKGFVCMPTGKTKQPTQWMPMPLSPTTHSDNQV